MNTRREPVANLDRTPRRLPWRLQTLAIVAGALAVLVAIVYAASHLILLRDYADLERQDIREHVARVRDVLLDDLAALDHQLNDWAAWDETYEFVRSRDPGYIKRNIPDETFVNLRLNAMIVADPQGNVIFARGYDFHAEKQISVSPDLLALLRPAAPLVGSGGRGKGIAGLVLIDRTPTLVAGRPILTSAQTGPSRGVMIWARYLDPAQIRRLSAITHLDVHAHVLDGRTLPDDAGTAAAAADPDRPIPVVPLSEEVVAGYTALPDLTGRPLVLLQVTGPRAIYAQGQASVRYFSIWFIVIGGLLGLVAASLFDSLVVSRILRRESEAKLHAIVEQASPVAIYSVAPDGTVQTWNPASARIFGWSKDEVIGRPLPTMPANRQQEFHALMARILAGEHISNLETIRQRKDGSLINVSISTAPLRANRGPVTGIMAVAADITARKRDEARIQRQLQRLSALRTIDIAITGSLDLRMTLDVLLEQVTVLLGIHAADVLLVDPATQRLTYAAGRGFRTNALQHTRLRIGDGHAGKAALERRVIHVEDLSADPGNLSQAPLLAQEGFRTYHAVPLIAKGAVKGVLEVFHREALAPDAEWTDFLEALAGQAAIAIDNAGLFTDLQKANTDLVLAYDTALEGWSKALDLRDRETEGHTRRVTELTITLARALGVGDADLVHMRRGSLLHDIGKMGIPDAILLKAGPLTDEEWVIMRRHPVYAYELLADIPYLRPALDITYCHHEKWDGSGYPRGLKGEQIPLAARIFAVIDVWDALTSDRPYRKAWTQEKAREHIREQAGKHFDPRVVETFLAPERSDV